MYYIDRFCFLFDFVSVYFFSFLFCFALHVYAIFMLFFVKDVCRLAVLLMCSYYLCMSQICMEGIFFTHAVPYIILSLSVNLLSQTFSNKHHVLFFFIYLTPSKNSMMLFIWFIYWWNDGSYTGRLFFLYFMHENFVSLRSR